MSFLLHPLQVVAAVLEEWVRHQQEKVIEFLQMETEVLLEQLGDKRILLSDDERRLLAVKGMALKTKIWRTFVSSSSPTRCATVAKSDEEMHNRVMFTIRCSIVPDPATHSARAPPIRADTLPFTSPRKIRHAA